jgi:hypothetical protein
MQLKYLWTYLEIKGEKWYKKYRGFEPKRGKN